MPFGNTRVRRRSWWPAALFALGALWLLAGRASFAGPAIAAGPCTPPRASLTPDGEEQALLGLINAYRAQNGLGSLTISPTLMKVAAWKSSDLAVNNYFAHDDRNRSWDQRFRDCGYDMTPVISEHLAAGNADAASTFQQWRQSPGHNAVMLDRTMKATGLARYYQAGSSYGWYWTGSFGGVVDGARPAASATIAASGGAASPGPALKVNETAVVSGAGASDCLRVRSAASSSAAVVDCLPDGRAMVVSDGPIRADGYTWWRLGILGWAADAYLAPLTMPGQ